MTHHNNDDHSRPDVGQIRQQLLDLRAEIEAQTQLNAGATDAVELDQSRMGRLSRMDAMQAQAMSQATHQRRLLILQRIEPALQRLDKGQWGLCVRCEDEIAPARLTIDPTCLLCLECASEAE